MMFWLLIFVKFSFLKLDGQEFMTSGSSTGHIAIWNLEKKKIQSQIQNAHDYSVCGMEFLKNQPLMITNSGDNSLKVCRELSEQTCLSR